QGLWPRAPYGVQAAARANTGVRRICSVGPLELPYRSREVALRDVEQLALAHGGAKISRPLRDRECPCGGEVMLGPLVEDAARGILRRAGAQQVVPVRPALLLEVPPDLVLHERRVRHRDAEARRQV